MKVLVAAVLLGGLFGSASATVEELGPDIMIVDIEVEVMAGAESVAAHLSFDDELVATLPLIDRGNGVYGIRTELEPLNYVVVFEIVGDETDQSDPVTMTQLGAELGPEAGPPTTLAEDDSMAPETQRLMWLAIALGAASLSVLAFWVLGGRDDREKEEGSRRDEEE